MPAPEPAPMGKCDHDENNGQPAAGEEGRARAASGEFSDGGGPYDNGRLGDDGDDGDDGDVESTFDSAASQTRRLWFLAAGAALAYGVSLRDAPYPDQAAAKVLMCALLFLACARHEPMSERLRLMAALAASGVGDALLALPQLGFSFVGGLGAFLVAHLAYCALLAPRAFGDFAAVRPLHVVGTRGYPWTEIDFPEDYERAVREILPAIEGAQFAAEEVRVNADTTIVVRGMRVPPDPQALPLQRASGE